VIVNKCYRRPTDDKSPKRSVVEVA